MVSCVTRTKLTCCGPVQSSMPVLHIPEELSNYRGGALLSQTIPNAVCIRKQRTPNGIRSGRREDTQTATTTDGTPGWDPGAEAAWKSPGFYHAGMVLSPSFISPCMLALDQGLSRQLGPEPSQRAGETQPEHTETRLSWVRVGGQSKGHETAHLFIYSLLAMSSVYSYPHL